MKIQNLAKCVLLPLGSTQKIFVGALREQNTFLRGQKSKTLSKKADFCQFFLLTGGREWEWGRASNRGGAIAFSHPPDDTTAPPPVYTQIKQRRHVQSYLSSRLYFLH